MRRLETQNGYQCVWINGNQVENVLLDENMDATGGAHPYYIQSSEEFKSCVCQEEIDWWRNEMAVRSLK